MEDYVIEAQYPDDFRLDEAQKLGTHLKNRHNVVLIGMRRVGIGSFMRFFLTNSQTVSRFIGDDKKHLFIPIDLNNLVEREIFPFWILTLKRISDIVEKSSLNSACKKFIELLFLDAIQSKDLFLLTEGVRKSLVRISEEGVLPTIFFIRFDRMKDAATPEFFDNLISLKDATDQKLSFVFTSYRPLDQLSPLVFKRSSVAAFCHEMYIKPTNTTESQKILEIYKNQYNLNLSPELEKEVLQTVDGYNQYLHLALIYLHEKGVKLESSLFDALSRDERIVLQSEELWDSFTDTEKEMVLKVSNGESLTQEEISLGKYLFDTGVISEKEDKLFIFSPLFLSFLQSYQEKKGNGTANVDFSKKEKLLYSFLSNHSNEVCERELIIEAVWPEEDNIGVSDWAIDRLVARLRNKMKLQKLSKEIVTVKTRGYKLVSS